MNYNPKDSYSLQYSLIKEYIDMVYGKKKIDFPDAYFYPMLLSGSPEPDRIIQYQRKFINYLVVSVVYSLLPNDLKKIFYLKFVKKLPSTNIAYRIQWSEPFIFSRINKIYKHIISLINYRIMDDDLLDSRMLLNLINLLDMRISILVRYNLTHYPYYEKLCRLRKMYSIFYSGYVDLYCRSDNDSVSKVVMLWDFDREISVSFLAEKLNYSSSYIYLVLKNAQKKIKKLYDISS